MRLIPIVDLELDIPRDWRERAEHAFDEVRELPPADRAAAINARSQVWSDLKPRLERLSSGKCWYCESREVRADKAIDHFRPKNRVAESEAGDGYWWLAFDWRNYRYSCAYCNERRKFEETSGGKRDHFPLLDESTRGAPEAPPSDLDDRENPMLLDPTDPDDVLLLTFDLADGSPAAVADKTQDPIGYNRAMISIEIYHLREKALQRMRFEKMLEVRDRLRTAEELAKHDASKSAYQREVVMIARAIAPGAEFSAAAKAMLRGLRGESRLAETILDRL
jgi:uncharacterized protein (TIGR02646 family)